MGTEPDAPNHKVATLGRLTPEIEWVQLDHIPLGAHDALVKHENANRTTTLRNHNGPATLTWEARFAGSFDTLSIDGTPRRAEPKSINGVNVSFLQLVVPAGQQKTVKVP